jgi:hypothetical protein
MLNGKSIVAWAVAIGLLVLGGSDPAWAAANNGGGKAPACGSECCSPPCHTCASAVACANWCVGHNQYKKSQDDCVRNCGAYWCPFLSPADHSDLPAPSVRLPGTLEKHL